jgi:hypothetical protein
MVEGASMQRARPHNYHTCPSTWQRRHAILRAGQGARACASPELPAICLGKVFGLVG